MKLCRFGDNRLGIVDAEAGVIRDLGVEGLPKVSGYPLSRHDLLIANMVTADEFGRPEGKRLTIKVNGVTKQESNTSKLIYDVPRLIEFASAFYTLEPGDLIYTGTPAGVSPIREGDVMVSQIDGIGTMTVKIKGKSREKSPR
ncbi:MULTISPECIES: fumarylacetoacetate hydrolase family protein [unclassified Beijerinckia]|uniref:fumarylacetoacetate hydrolase family protein n=1 Tax=unclassified Beijerinckia TaxID=2638183 RepID=UPI0014800B85|nr:MULTISPECIES: fumarylacetoacetate hydrolase family protein [unclassified Beijerinckia]MDH7795932.1 2-keto-4-pentenoate hydratase/2-oxohepta-3-ene-1,7-dioic acid hydratase in catechol pathway [Beijerinckia sp. GAS462]